MRLLVLLAVLVPANLGGVAFGDGQIEYNLRARIAERPNDAANWRMLGRVLRNRGEVWGAYEACERAVQLDRESPAAHYDLGCLLLDMGRPVEAIDHLRIAVELAPDGDYAADALARLEELKNADPSYGMLVSHQVPWLAAPRADDYLTDAIVAEPPGPGCATTIETGLMFNSNVELAPISRQLSISEQSSFQAYVSPAIDYTLLESSDWQIAASLDSYFNLNEGNLRAFNLQHLQPGVYYDRRMNWAGRELVARIRYDYAYDLFDGRTYGNRHALTNALTVFDEQPISTTYYWTIDQTDFRDDGPTPAIDSVDGMTNTVGISRTWEIARPHVRRLTFGADAQWADLRGRDHEYRGVFLYADAELPSVWSCVFVPSAGWGYREFPDFTGTPSRDENLIVAAARLERCLTRHQSITGFCTFEQFDTDNDLYSASRYTTGVYYTFQP